MFERKTFRPKKTREAWQYQIKREREEYYKNKNNIWDAINKSLKNAVIKPCTRKQAEKIILEYEWLGDMAVTNIFYGIFFENIMGGTICINSSGSSPNSEKSFGIKKGELSYFARGACAYWTPVGTASKLLSFALKLEKKRGAKAAIAYADTDAGEYGTVYQATNWFYIGKSIPGGADLHYSKNNYILDGRTMTEYAKRNNMSMDKYRIELEANGWILQRKNPKHRYFYILADEPLKTVMFNKIKHLIKPYPKRSAPEA